MTTLLTEIDHVAIAVRDLEAAIAYYHDTYGCDVEHREVDVLAARRVHVDLWVRHLLDHGAAASSTARRLSALTSFYHHLITHDVLTELGDQVGEGDAQEERDDRQQQEGQRQKRGQHEEDRERPQPAGDHLLLAGFGLGLCLTLGFGNLKPAWAMISLPRGLLTFLMNAFAAALFELPATTAIS